MRNWLHNKIGFTNFPLSYVIFKDTTPFTINHYEMIIYNASLNTYVFKADRRNVSNLFKLLVLDNYSFEWVSRKFVQVNGR